MENEEYSFPLRDEQLKRSYWNNNVPFPEIRETMVDHPPEEHQAHKAVVRFMLGRQYFNESLSRSAIAAPDITEFERVFRPLTHAANLKSIQPQNYRGLDVRPVRKHYPVAFQVFPQAEQRFIRVVDSFARRQPQFIDEAGELYISAISKLTRYRIVEPSMKRTHAYIESSAQDETPEVQRFLGAAMLAAITGTSADSSKSLSRRQQSDERRENREIASSPEELVSNIMEFGVGGNSKYLRMRCGKTMFETLDRLVDAADSKEAKTARVAKDYLRKSDRWEIKDPDLDLGSTITLANLLTKLLAQQPELKDIKKIEQDDPAALVLAVDRILYAARHGVELDAENINDVVYGSHAARLYAAMASPEYNNRLLTITDLKVRFPGLREPQYADLHRYSQGDSDEVGLMRHYMQMTARVSAS